MCPSYIEGIPLELLEQIALFATCDTFLGPPTDLVSLLCTSRHIYSRISPHANHYLYARIFAFKFDLRSAIERLGSDETINATLTRELSRRFLFLKQIRSGLKSKRSTASDSAQALRDLLFQGYLLMLENDGKNESQLRDYANIDGWLKQFWFGEHGGSCAQMSIDHNLWPSENENSALAMWLFWFILRPGESATLQPSGFRSQGQRIIKTMTRG